MWRPRRSRPELDGVAELAAAHLAVWRVLSDEERRRLVELAGELITTKRWEAARDFELTDEIVVTIAGGAALLVLELGGDAYRQVTTIVVHPSLVTLPGVHAGPIDGTVTDAPSVLAGQAGHGYGPVVIAWRDARRSARHLTPASNVVLHEFAHKLDMLDGTVDGTPPLADQAGVEEWVRVCTPEYERLRAGEFDPLLRAYAATNPGEFFAVATEVFFGRPRELLAAKPQLYAVLQGFYRQDPAARLERLSPIA